MAMHKQFIEYRVRDVSRFIVTRYESGPDGGQGSTVIGEYTSADTAYSVGYALAQAEHRRLGWPVGDERISYPQHPNDLASRSMRHMNSTRSASSAFES